MQLRDMNLMHFIFRYPFKNNDANQLSMVLLKKNSIFNDTDTDPLKEITTWCYLILCSIIHNPNSSCHIWCPTFKKKIMTLLCHLPVRTPGLAWTQPQCCS